MDFETITPSQWIENEETFSKLLDDQTIRDKIPLLNVNKAECFKNLSLVRFCGMIQDMHSPEYFLEKFEVINKGTRQCRWMTGKYNDNVLITDDEYVNLENLANVTSERQTFVVISVPGVNSWVRHVDNKFHILVPEGLPASSNKRLHEEIKDIEAGPSNDHNPQKKLRTEDPKTTGSQTFLNYPKDIFPLSTQDDQVYHLMIYKDQDKVKINDVCEFVGFLETQPVSISKTSEDEMDVDVPAFSCSKIHCISFKKMKHNNPLVEEQVTKTENIDMIRKDLLLVLTQLLLGDELAANYLLCHLISQVYLRREGMALGKFSLNISNSPNLNDLSYPTELYKFIEKLVPKSFYLPMTLENLNDLTFVPKKNYVLDYLSSGVLQLSDNTHFVLDETQLSPGKLNEAGLNNIKALSSCIKHQSINYDFKFYPLEFECDIPFLIISEGKSMIHSDVHIVLEPEETCFNNFREITEAANHFLKPELLNNIRKYLTMARMSEYTITDTIETFVQNEFVKMRQDKNSTADDLHKMLILARLISLSEGKSTLCEDSWKSALDMEERRKSRIKN